MIDLSITNFRNIREARLIDSTPLSLIVGMNESGKSSLIGAIKYACLGTAFGRKAGATVDGLVRHGEDKMAVRLSINNIMVARTKSQGDALKSVAERFGVAPELMPLLFDAKIVGDGGSKAMRAFLDTSASVAFDAMLHFANDPPVLECVKKARLYGATTTKAIVQYCESCRSAQRAPAQPVMPKEARPTDDMITAAAKAVSDAAEVEQQAADVQTQLALTGQRVSQILQFKNELVAYERQRAVASQLDPLKDKRRHLQRVLSINLNTFDAVAKVLSDAEYSQHEFVTELKHLIIGVIEHAKQTLATNPAPSTMPNVPVLTQEATDLALSFAGMEPGSGSAVEAVSKLSDKDLRDTLTDLATQSDIASATLKEARANLSTLRNAHTALVKTAGAWESYDKSIPTYESEKLFSETEWARWDHAAKSVMAAETKHVNEVGDKFGQMVADFSAPILQGRKIRISRDEGIFLGLDSIDDCSESTRWRIEIAIMAAIGIMLKSPILLLDGADILDPVNKQAVQLFLLEHIVPRFVHTIVTSTTIRPLEEEGPVPAGVNATKWIMDKGTLRKV